MSGKSRLREKATHHYQGDDPLLEKSIEQAESAASAKLPSEAMDPTRQTDAMGGISKESLTSMASAEEMSRKPKKKIKSVYRKLSKGFVADSSKALTPQLQPQKESQPRISALRFESAQAKPASALSFEQPGKEKRQRPFRNVLRLPSPWQPSRHANDEKEAADHNASRNALQAAQNHLRVPRARPIARAIQHQEALQLRSLRQRADRFATEQVKKQSGKNLVSRYIQKQRIKREYIRAYRASAGFQRTAVQQKAAQRGLKKFISKVTQTLKSRAALYGALVLVLLLLVGSIASFAVSATTVMGGNIIAGLGESLRGSEGMVEVARSQLGQVGGEPYWSWYGFPSRVEWCAIFVSWVADQVGLISEGLFPKFAGCSIGEDWFRSNNLWQDGGYCPAPGEIIFYDWDGDAFPDHVGIVESCDGGTVYTIEGNWADSVHTDSFPVNSPYIRGYGSPGTNE